MIEFVIYGIVGVLAAFIAVGAITLLDAMRKARKAKRAAREETDPITEPDGPAPPAERGMIAALRRYVGPVGPEHRFFNAPARVAIEFGSSLFGFPGLGWLISGKVVTGIVLFILGPGAFYAFLPAYFVVTGRLAEDPFLIARMLPVVATVSAGALALHQTGVVHARGRREIET